MTMMIDGHGPGYHAVQTRPNLEDCQRTLKKFVDEAASPTVSVQDLVVASRATKDSNAQWWIGDAGWCPSFRFRPAPSHR